MGWLSIRKFNNTISASRGDLRRQLHQAAHGNTDAFQAVANHYLDLITEYLVVSGYHEPDRIRSYARDVFHNLWLRIAYTRRVSDFERQLFIFLKQIPVNVAPFQDVLIQKLVMLNSMQRFLVVARDLEIWTSRNLGLATRISKAELSKSLFEAWKILVGFQRDGVDFATCACMEKVVDNMECTLDQLEQQKLCKKVKKNPTVAAFKADCLLLRCELVELRQNSRWDDSLKTEFFAELKEDMALITPLKPELSERLKNQLSFEVVHLDVKSS